MTPLSPTYRRSDDHGAEHYSQVRERIRQHDMSDIKDWKTDRGWICKRCEHENDEDDTECFYCGKEINLDD